MLYIPTENESLLLHPLISPFGNCTSYLIANIKQNLHTKCQNILIIHHLRDVGVWVNSGKWEHSKKLQRYWKRGREMVQRWKYWTVMLFLALLDSCSELYQTGLSSAFSGAKSDLECLSSPSVPEEWSFSRKQLWWCTVRGLDTVVISTVQKQTVVR